MDVRWGALRCPSGGPGGCPHQTDAPQDSPSPLILLPCTICWMDPPASQGRSAGALWTPGAPSFLVAGGFGALRD